MFFATGAVGLLLCCLILYTAGFPIELVCMGLAAAGFEFAKHLLMHWDVTQCRIANTLPPIPGTPNGFKHLDRSQSEGGRCSILPHDMSGSSCDGIGSKGPPLRRMSTMSLKTGMSKDMLQRRSIVNKICPEKFSKLCSNIEFNQD